MSVPSPTAPTCPATLKNDALRVIRAGRVDYDTAWGWQRETADAVRNGTAPETLYLLEHPRVVTLGRRAKTDGNLRLTRDELSAQGVAVVETNRGGDVTYHGPGQLVGYPILDLRRRKLGARQHLHVMEECLIRALAHFGIVGGRHPDYVGVWTDSGKIAAMGIRVSAGVSLHGFALNVNTDLNDFNLIVPCGISHLPVAGMSAILGRNIDLDEVMDRVEEEFRNPPAPPSELPA